MASIIDLKTFSDKRGNLTVIEKIFPFEIKRVFYIYGVDESTRGYHRHKRTIQVATSIQGSCTIWVQKGIGHQVEKFDLDRPSKGLLIEPTDFHWMDNFSKDCILMVFASEYYDEKDYIYEKYEY